MKQGTARHSRNQRKKETTDYADYTDVKWEVSLTGLPRLARFSMQSGTISHLVSATAAPHSMDMLMIRFEK